MSNETRADSWNHLSDLLFEGAWQADLGRIRSPWVFRGQGDADFDLTNSLQRLGPNFREVETPLLRAFRRYAYRNGPGGLDTVWNWLALAQHHGLPTRLLDWSYSPYVALHFATAEATTWDRDGAVWCVDFAHFNRRLPDVMQEVLRAEGATVFTAEMIAECAETVTALDSLAADPFLLFFEPPSFDDRIVNQFALFALMSGADTVMGQWLREQESEALRRVVIPAGLKREVRDRLDQIGVTERVLLPGLDGLSAWLSRYYGYRSEE
jgi:hypothetical protein